MREIQYMAYIFSIIIIIILTILLNSNDELSDKKDIINKTIDKKINNDPSVIPNKELIKQLVLSEIKNNSLKLDTNNEKIKNYDYKKIYDPLVNPTRRVARHEIHPLFLKRQIDLPTRGYPDNFIQLGILIKKGDTTTNQDNKILRLFGRQEYPGSNIYEYYGMINSGLDKIKIPIEVKSREIYDGDNIYIKQLNENYEVQLYKYDAPKYYPDII